MVIHNKGHDYEDWYIDTVLVNVAHFYLDGRESPIANKGGMAGSSAVLLLELTAFLYPSFNLNLTNKYC